MKKQASYKSVVSDKWLVNSKNLPKGFWAEGIACGIKRKDKKDLALFYSQVPAKAVGVFTANQVKSAPVVVSKEQLAKSDGVRAIITNSGCANACTGTRGLNDAKEMCNLTARLLGLKPGSVLVASTGVIGRYLPMPKIRQGIKNLVTNFLHCSIAPSLNYSETAVEAIMTTDTFPKIVSKKIFLPSLNPNPYPLIPVSIWSCAKGAGMIHPDLATLLCFILTDIAIDRRLLEKALKTAVNQSFNCITVDGETSTNDTVFLLANGLAGNQPIKKEDNNFRKFQNVLNKVTLDLAKMVTKDGEGATKLVKIVVKNARNSQEAKKVAKAIALSPLVKTAFFGADPNWGRIIGAIGHSGVKIIPEKIDLYFDNLSVTHK
ncbi:MAG TPA: hypothetical protein DHV62_03610, partial [Elusimicrobia bacterium]|nr:hypothetical protein [Elusimicrobiota bacterium]